MAGDRILPSIENVMVWFSRKVKQSLADYVDVETVDDPNTFILRDGSRMSLVQLHGTYQLVGAQEFQEIDRAVASNLTAYLKSGGHEIHVVFNDDPDSIDRVVREKLRPSMETAKRLQLDLDDLFEEDIRTMSKYCSHEAVYLVLFTRPKAVAASDLKRDVAAKLELLKANPLPKAIDAPNLFAAIGALRSRHNSFVSQLLSDLRVQRMDAQLLDVHAAAREMRASADPSFTDLLWQARLFGDKIPVRVTGKAGDVSGQLWPRLDSQLIPRDGSEVSLNVVEVGDRIYCPMHVTLQPSEIKPFAALFNRVRESRMPWRITFRIGSGGLASMGFKGLVGAIFGWTSKDNGLIEEAVKHVQAVVRDGTALDVAYRVDFMTWAPKGKEDMLADRAARLARAIQGWGGAETAETSGDVHEAFVSNCLGMRDKGIGPVSCAVLEDVTPMLPLYRPTSPWREGAVLYRTNEGKIWPYQPNSPVQSSWISVMYAEMRAGKTLNGNQINLALCLAPGLVRLPLIGIVDIGRGSAGLISVLANALPPSLKHLVASIRLRMTPEFAVNPFDTQLGARYPLPHEKVFQKNFLLTLVTPPGQSAVEDGLDGMAEMAIEYAYKYYAETAPKRYVANLADTAEVDAAIQRWNIEIDEATTWWEIVDGLFVKGDHHMASLAQRMAMPLLTDIASVSRERVFEDMYGEKALPDGESLQKAFARRLSEAVRSFPILDKPTRFDVGLARVVSIDLDEVAKSGGNASMKRQTAVVYMLARHITARHFFLHTDDIGFWPPMYREFQEKRIREIMQDKKHLQYDEFHVTEGVGAVRDQVKADMRVTGKLGVKVTLISQDIKDFDGTMLAFATCKFILSRANRESIDHMKKVFGMTETVEHVVQNEIRPPNKDGSTFLGMFKTKASEVDAVQLLRNTVGGIKLWAFSTTNEDVIVRDALYSRIGPTETRRFLAKLYPGGSVVDEIERRKNAMSQAAMVDVTDKGEGVIVQLIDELVDLYESTRRQALAA
ncbi:MAG: type IV secretion protein IcmB [Burkholderiaceae bacterium]|nr:MAG: type IV secretion protein IcmB [Burkholderiaceae bacterium]